MGARQFLLIAIALGVSISSAEAQTASGRIAADPASAYWEIKRTIMADRKSHFSGTDGYGGDPSAFDRETRWAIMGCDVGEAMYAVRGPIKKNIVNLAVEVIQIQGALLEYNIPRQLWEEDLSALEKKGSEC